MGCVRVEERVLAAFGGLVEAPTRFEAGRDVSGGGVLWALPALLANGLLHRQAECFKLRKGFYGVVHVLLLMGFLALARVKSLERLRFEAPGEWGHLLGLDRIPEVHTLRGKLGQMAQGPQVETWSAGLSRQWMEQAPELAGRLYMDGHVRVYHGHQTPLPKRYVAREKLCLRGTTDYWINDREGRPFFVVNTAANPGLIAVLRQEIIPRLVKEVPHQPKAAELQADPYRCRFVMIFDREGYSPELFAELWGQRIAAQTYRKGTLEDWPVEEFQEPEVVLPNGEKQSMKLAERGVWLGKKLWVREIRLLGSDGHQTAVVSTDFQSGLVQIARQMFSRWAQENWFKVRHEVVRVIVQYEDHKMNLQFRLQVALPAPARLATVGSEAAGTTYPLSSRGRRGPRGTLCGCQHQGGRGVRLSDMPNVSELPQASLSLTSQKMLIRLEPKGKQPVASLLSRGTRTFTAAGVKAGAKSFVLLERNVINPTSRLIRRQVAPQGRPRRWRAEERWRKPTPSCNGTDRGWNMAPPRKRADFQQVVHHENAGRTFAGGNRK